MSATINMPSIGLVNNLSLVNPSAEQLQTVFKFENENTSDSSSTELVNYHHQQQQASLQAHQIQLDNQIDYTTSTTNKSIKTKQSKLTNKIKKENLNKKQSQIKKQVCVLESFFFYKISRLQLLYL